MQNIYRPAYHFRPEQNWMNDPDGPLYYEGEYHLFYQYNPYGDSWGTIHWGHAKSRDLIHWEECPVALYPDASAQERHCYSGCAFLDDGVPTIYYTSVGEGASGPEEGARQRAAVSRDGMMTWVKQETPALDRSLQEEKGVHIMMWRDPFVWSEEDGRYALLGGTLSAPGREEADIREGRGCLALYYAPHGKSWEFKNIILVSDQYYLLECPNMIRFHDKYLLLYSPLDAVRYQIGTLDKINWTFRAEKEGIFDHSILKKGFYAPNTYLNDPQGRKLVIGWVSEADREKVPGVHGWAGIQSLPREVNILGDELIIRPARECLSLRKEKLYEWKETEDGIKQKLAAGKALEIEMHLELGAPMEAGKNNGFTLSIFSSADGREHTDIRYSDDNGGLTIDRSAASLWEGSAGALIKAELEEKDRHSVRLRIFLDHSVVEVYANEHIAMTARVYPSLPDSSDVQLHKEGNVTVAKLDIWELAL